jgi:hypothetical protein
MFETFLLKDQLETLIQKNWATVINSTAFMKTVLSDAQNAELTKLSVAKMPPRHTKIVVTKVIVNEDIAGFDLWAEFTVPRSEGCVIGTHIYRLSFNGKLDLQESFGTFFVPQS